MGLIGEVYADAGLHVDKASFAQYAAMLKQAEGQIGDMSSSTKLAMASAFTMPAAAVAGIAAYGVSIGASYETAAIKLETLYGTQQRAREEFQWLADFAASTPFEFPELLEVDGMLKNAGLSAQDYIKTVGDASSANNKSIQQTTEAIVDAMTGEYERLKEYGITSVDIASTNYEKLGLKVEDVGKRALMAIDKNGKEQIMVVDKNNKQMIASTILAFWNDKYAGAMEKQSASITGLYSTIKDNIKTGLAELVGFDMSDTINGMKIETFSLLGALSELAGVAVTVTGAFAGMSEPMQTFVLVSTIAATGLGLLAAGLIGYTLIAPLVTAETTAMAVSISAAIWPATLIVGALALVAAGLVYLDEKTGIITYSWNLMKDIFTIAAYYIGQAMGWLHDWIVEKIDGIQAKLSEMVPEGFVDGVTTVWNTVTSVVSDAGDSIHNKAVEIGQDQEEIGNSAVEAGEKVETGTSDMKNGYDAAGLSALLAGGNTKTATDLMISGTGAAGDSANDMKKDFIDATGGVNALTTSIQSSSSAASTFIGYLKNVSSGLATARQNATAAAAAMQAAGASMEQAQKAYHSYMTSLKSENALGISSQGGSGTGEGNVKVKTPANMKTASEVATRKANNTVYNNNITNKNTINNNGDKLSTSKAKAAGV